MAKKKRASTAAVPVSHALIGIARDLELRMLTRLGDEGGHSGLRPSLGPFLSLVWLEARPVGELAQCLGVSKQACSRLARVALTAGYLARRSGSASLRGQLVELSPRGRLLVEDAIGIIREAGTDYESRVGSDRFDRLAESVAALYRVLEVQPIVDPGRRASIVPPLGGLPQLAIELQRRLIQATMLRGHHGLQPSQALVLPLIGREGSRVRDLARRHRVTRQSISSTGLELEALGYLRRESDPLDRRGTILHRTPRGDRLLADAVASAEALDRKLAKQLGDAPFDSLREAALFLFDALKAVERRSSPAHGSRSRLRVVASSPEAASNAPELDALASSLRRRLGAEDALRLGAMLVGDRADCSRIVGDLR